MIENKSKIMKCTRRLKGRRMIVALNGQLFGKVKCFEYLGSKMEVKSKISDV